MTRHWPVATMAESGAQPDKAERDFDAEVADCWFEYLEATRDVQGKRYHEIESWAWVRLKQRLKNVDMSRFRAA